MAAKRSARRCCCCHVAPPTPGYRSCEPCRTAQRERQQAKRAERIAAGLCARCGINPAAVGVTQCEPCRDAQRAHHIELWENRILDGVCPQCGKRPPARNRRLCRVCQRADRNRKRVAGPKHDPTAAERIARWKARQRAAGRCIACGQRTGTNPRTGKPYAHCPVHRVIARHTKQLRKRKR